MSTANNLPIFQTNGPMSAQDISNYDSFEQQTCSTCKTAFNEFMLADCGCNQYRVCRNCAALILSNQSNCPSCNQVLTILSLSTFGDPSEEFNKSFINRLFRKYAMQYSRAEVFKLPFVPPQDLREKIRLKTFNADSIVNVKPYDQLPKYFVNNARGPDSIAVESKIRTPAHQEVLYPNFHQSYGSESVQDQNAAERQLRQDQTEYLKMFYAFWAAVLISIAQLPGNQKLLEQCIKSWLARSSNKVPSTKADRVDVFSKLYAEHLKPSNERLVTDVKYTEKLENNFCSKCLGQLVAPYDPESESYYDSHSSEQIYRYLRQSTETALGQDIDRECSWCAAHFTIKRPPEVFSATSLSIISSDMHPSDQLLEDLDFNEEESYGTPSASSDDPTEFPNDEPSERETSTDVAENGHLQKLVETIQRETQTDVSANDIEFSCKQLIEENERVSDQLHQAQGRIEELESLNAVTHVELVEQVTQVDVGMSDSEKLCIELCGANQRLNEANKELADRLEESKIQIDFLAESLASLRAAFAHAMSYPGVEVRRDSGHGGIPQRLTDLPAHQREGTQRHDRGQHTESSHERPERRTSMNNSNVTDRSHSRRSSRQSTATRPGDLESVSRQYPCIGQTNNGKVNNIACSISPIVVGSGNVHANYVGDTYNIYSCHHQYSGIAQTTTNKEQRNSTTGTRSSPKTVSAGTRSSSVNPAAHTARGQHPAEHSDRVRRPFDS